MNYTGNIELIIRAKNETQCATLCVICIDLDPSRHYARQDNTVAARMTLAKLYSPG